MSRQRRLPLWGFVYCEWIRLFLAKCLQGFPQAPYDILWTFHFTINALNIMHVRSCCRQSPEWYSKRERLFMMIIGGLSINNKTSLKKWSCAKLQTFKFFSSSLKMLAIFLELNSKRLYWSSGKEKESRLVFKSSTKREIRHFHVIVVQCQKRNVQKSMMHMQYCCFANFLPFSLYCRHRCLSAP